MVLGLRNGYDSRGHLFSGKLRILMRLRSILAACKSSWCQPGKPPDVVSMVDVLPLNGTNNICPAHANGAIKKAVNDYSLLVRM
ncbi:hypothetical protein L1987_78710 [Smallanthus sonchifolius]|uniref:Uncharacterized protein n=1 Tax=Smallanthus sonchifolius TaxID=185202 RepID=A0ACB8ZEH5_9ASTR|nr:hypothetical protein L1987_78710 [Smallanthus sonchifolius]